MACFVVPAAEAVAVAVAEKHGKTNFVRKLKWLRNMLLGGSVLLAFEHVWHGEIVAWFPFLTAMSNASDRMEMFREIATVGTAMALAITAVWGVMVLVSSRLEKRAALQEAAV